MFCARNRVPDYLDMLEDYEREQQKELDRLPECAECGNPIQDEDCYEINGELICPKCLDYNHRRSTEDYAS